MHQSHGSILFVTNTASAEKQAEDSSTQQSHHCTDLKKNQTQKRKG